MEAWSMDGNPLKYSKKRRSFSDSDSFETHKTAETLDFDLSYRPYMVLATVALRFLVIPCTQSCCLNVSFDSQVDLPNTQSRAVTSINSVVESIQWTVGPPISIP